MKTKNYTHYPFLWLYLIFLNCFIVWSQNNDIASAQINQIQNAAVPPSPEVAALGKHIETPINEFTGIPKIGIPLYTINQNRINHSISLSYHAQGVKVEEIASRVGMGWTLNAGGIVSRQKRGSPDEMPQHGYLRTTETVEKFLESDHSDSYFSLLYDEANVHEHDFEPDVFNFSFGGYSGKFFFDQETHGPIFEEASPIKVEWIDYAYFKITTPDGVQYYFGEDKDRTTTTKQIKGGDDVMDIYTTGKYGSWPDETSTYVLNSPEYVATWYLKEIYDPISEESITFQYEEYNLGKLNQRLSSSVLLEYRPSAITSIEHSLSEQEVKEYMLTEINFNNGSIDFIKDTNERKDLSGSFALKQINIYSNNDIIKSYGLENSFIKSERGLIPSYGYDVFQRFYNLDDIQYRLFLNSLMEYGIENNTILLNNYKRHIFEYNNPERLPHRFSTAMDFWGFHNGEINNLNLLPKDYEKVGNKIVDLGESKRQINENYSQDGVLSKITYPTGGTVEYTYENNRAKKDVSGNNFYDSRLNPLYYSYNSELINYSYNDNNSQNNVSFHSGTSPYYVMEFSIDSPIVKDDNGDNILTKVGINYTNNHNYYFQNPNYQYCTDPGCVDLDEPHWEAYIQKKVNGVWPSSHMSSRVYNFEHESGLYLDEAGLNEVYLEPQQEYRIIINWIDETSGSYDSNYHGPDDWNISLNYLLEDEIEIDEKNAVLSGGLRVKEIKTDDLAGSIDTTTYLYQDDNGETTGHFVSLPYHVSNLGYYYYRGIDRITCCPSFIESNYFKEYVLGIKYTAQSSIPLAMTQSSYTGYEKVTKVRRGGENGKSEYNFSFERNTLDLTKIYKPSYSVNDAGVFAFSPVPLKSKEIQRGKLLSKINYNASGDTIQKTVNSYNLKRYRNINAVNPSLIINDSRGLIGHYTGDGTAGFNLHNHLNTLTPLEHVVNKYTLKSHSNLLSLSIISSYDSNGNNPITSRTKYFYDNDNHLQITRVETTNSQNEILTTKTSYAHEANNLALINQHRITEP
ncbi:hypothetical protein OAC51_07450, partial [Flavobacteriaceae bacterium]|nr:hypothetical protein [Flavobacteriaceae bacterium]